MKRFGKLVPALLLAAALVCGMMTSAQAAGDTHVWNYPTWTWADDHSSATATFVGTDCGETQSVESTSVDCEEVKPASCGQDRVVMYIAYVDFEGFVYDTASGNVTVADTALSHTYGEPAWEWADDYSSATATFICRNCGDRVTVTDDSPEQIVFLPASCTQDELVLFNATVTHAGVDYSYMTEEVSVPGTATGHAYGEPAWTWANDYSSATATFTCANCGQKKTVKDNAPVITEVTPADCEDDQVVSVCASVTFGGQTYSATTEGTLGSATGHSYGEPAWEWADDCSSATATFTCENCDATETVRGSADVHVVRNENCTEDRIIAYAVCVSFDGTDYSITSDEVAVSGTALGHDFGEWTVTTAATYDTDGEETRTCSRCSAAETRTVPSGRTLQLSLCASAERVHPGDTVEVTVDVAHNPGVVGLSFNLSYDPDVLELTDVQGGGMLLNGYFTPGSDMTAMPYSILWEDAVAQENYLDTGTILTLTFTVRDTAAAGSTTVTLLSDCMAVDLDLKDVPLAFTGADLCVAQHIPGDSNGDGLVDVRDVTALTRWIAGGWNVEIDALNADVDGSGEVSMRDVVLIRRFLADWDVVLV